MILPTHIIATAGVVLNDHHEVLLVKNNRRGWEIPGGIVEIGENVIDALKREVFEETGVEIMVKELFCVSSNTGMYPGYNGVKEVPTKIILDYICCAVSGIPKGSEENSESAFFPMDTVPDIITAPAMLERYKSFLEYSDRPAYLEYVTKPRFNLKLKRSI